MTPEDEDLLLIDISARLPYGVKFPYHKEEDCNHRECDCVAVIDSIGKYNVEFTYEDNGYPIEWSCSISQVKPYLRPMSSMTEEECIEFGKLPVNFENISEILPNTPYYIEIIRPEQIDWLNKNMFDYRGLIPKDLATETTKENNPYED